MSADKKKPGKAESDWEKELDGVLGEIKDATGPVEMRKLEPAPEDGEPESAAAAHGKALTDSVFASDLDELEEITSPGDAGSPFDAADVADTEDLAGAVEEAPAPDEKPEHDPASRTDFSIAVEDIFAKMVSEAKEAGIRPPGEELSEGVAATAAVEAVQEIAEARADADDFTDAVSKMFQDVAQRAETLVRRVNVLESEREDLARRAGEAEGSAEREVARSQALEERLRELEKLRAETLSRVRELESELADQVDVVMQEKISRLEGKLVEAYDIIKVIEDAFLSGLPPA